MFELELVPLCTMELKIGDVFTVGRTPFGHRGIGEIIHGRLEGDRLRADMAGRAAADWAMVSDDGLVRGDIRMTWRTDDGALLFLTYTALMDVDAPAYSTPHLETGDERYAWLNRVQLVAKGRFDPEAMDVRYQLYELR